MAAIATFALKARVWFRRFRLLIVSPDSRGTACPLSGRNSTYRPVQILEAGSGDPLYPPTKSLRLRFLIIIRQINHLMKVGHPITNGPAAFGLDVNIDNESLFEKIVIGFAYLMLDTLFRQIRRIK